MDELDRVLQVAQRAARTGGAIARATIDAPDQHFSWKRSRDPFVAQALPVQDAILATIRESFPDHAILAEEGPKTNPCQWAPTHCGSWIRSAAA